MRKEITYKNANGINIVATLETGNGFPKFEITVPGIETLSIVKNEKGILVPAMMSNVDGVVRWVKIKANEDTQAMWAEYSKAVKAHVEADKEYQFDKAYANRHNGMKTY